MKNVYLKAEKHRFKVAFLIVTFLFSRSMYLFLSKGIHLGYENWKFYASLFGVIGYSLLVIYSFSPLKKCNKTWHNKVQNENSE
jgi:magnesium-transporting ATPase (P-type)